MQGVIIENIANLYKVENNKKEIYEAYARGKLKKDEITPVVGDFVQFEHTAVTHLSVYFHRAHSPAEIRKPSHKLILIQFSFCHLIFPPRLPAA